MMAFLQKRSKTYYIHDRVGGRLVRTSLKTKSLQIAKEKLRQYESAKIQGLDSPLPTRTPIADVVTAYIQHIRTTKTPKSAQTDIYYLRGMFGQICNALKLTSRNLDSVHLRRPCKQSNIDNRRRVRVIEASYFEQITTVQIATFISEQVRCRGLAPKTANRYREILVRVFNWSLNQKLIRTPGGVNPAAAVERYRESAPQIKFLTIKQIGEQLEILQDHLQLRAMVAVLIYAGLRREELLWLTNDDVQLDHEIRGGVIRVRAKTIDNRSWQPKTKINRVVPISMTLFSYLKMYNNGDSTLEADCGWYFPSPRGSWWDPDNFSKELRKINASVGLLWSCLDFRHTFGSQLAQKGVSLYKIATLLGNSPEICRRHYAALILEAMNEEVEFDSRGHTMIVA